MHRCMIPPAMIPRGSGSAIAAVVARRWRSSALFASTTTGHRIQPMHRSTITTKTATTTAPVEHAVRRLASTTSKYDVSSCRRRCRGFGTDAAPSAAAPSSVKKIGFVGLGNMGLPMCLNLIRNREEEEESVIAFDLNESSLEQAEKHGAIAASSLDEVGQAQCDLIVTSLPSCAASEDVVTTLSDHFAAAVVEESPSSGCIVVDTSTVSPMTSRSLSDLVSSKGMEFHYVDAPVSGGVRGATDGTLTFMAGCKAKAAALDVATPFLKRMGKNVVHCGDSGAGSATKLCNNLALAAQMVGICEAMNLGDKLGVDPTVLSDVMNASTAKCWSCEVNNPHPDVSRAKGGTTPASNEYVGGFGTRLMLKDLGLAVESGAEAGVALPVGTLTKELYKMAELRGLGEKDFGVMLQYLRGK